MSLADELLADLEDLDNDDSDTEDVKIKDEPNDEDEIDHKAPDEDAMEIDESVRGFCFLLLKKESFKKIQFKFFFTTLFGL